jgi:hypothetical protein
VRSKDDFSVHYNRCVFLVATLLSINLHEIV